MVKVVLTILKPSVTPVTVVSVFPAMKLWSGSSSKDTFPVLKQFGHLSGEDHLSRLAIIFAYLTYCYATNFKRRGEA